MTDKQIVEFPTAPPSDTDLLVKQSSGGTYQKCTFKQVADEVLDRVPEVTQTIDLPELTSSTVSTVSDKIRLQRASTEDEYHITIGTLRRVILEAVYPIGSYYFNHSNTNNPSSVSLLGFGTWVAVRGRVLVGEGTGTDINGTSVIFSAGTSGGEYFHTLTTSEMPNHYHYLFTGGAFGVTSIAGFPERNVAYDIDFGGNESWLPGESINTPDEGRSGTAGASASHNNVQPYQVVFMWRRTA